MNEPPVQPTFRQALGVWAKIGLLSFGGPAGQIAMMHRELVEKRAWLDERSFLHALNYCMLLPGPEAQQLAIYTGWLMHKTRGGIAAGLLFVLPGALLMWAIAAAYVCYGSLPWMGWLFYGLKAAVLAIVVAAVLRIGKKVLTHPLLWIVGLAALAGISLFKLPFPLVVISALLAGLLVGRRVPVLAAEEPSDSGADVTGGELPTWHATVLRGLFWLVIWLAAPVLCIALLGPAHVLAREAVFFSKAALLTFGGAYAVLPYVAQQAVETHAWLTAGQMIDGLGLAETTPGPLILVLQFVGFLGAWHEPGGMSPLLAATLGAAITLWSTFVPGFLFIFVGAPWVERSRCNARLAGALHLVTAAVVGVIANLALWFGTGVMIPQPGKIDLLPLALAVVFFLLLRSGKCGVVTVVGLGSLAGLAAGALGMA